MFFIKNILFYLLLIIFFTEINSKRNKYIRKHELPQLPISRKLYLWKFYVVPKNYLLYKKGTILGIYLRHCDNKITKNHFYISYNNASFYGQNDRFHTDLCEITDNKCLYYPHQSYFKIPLNVGNNLEEIEITSKITGEKRKFKLDTTASRNKPFDGITVCTPLLYYYNNWLQIFLFIEKWKEEKNVKIIIYYRGLSSDVYELLKYYQKLNIVHLVPAPIFPQNDPLENSTSTSIGMGPLYFNDCMYRDNTKFLTVMDVDEYFHLFNKNKKEGNLLEFIKKSVKLYPNKLFFNFQSFYISYINKDVSDSFQFATLGLLSKDPKNTYGKSIMLTNKMFYPSYHLPLFNYLESGHRFPKNQGIILHARPNIIFKSVKSKQKIRSLKEFERLNLVFNYDQITKKLNKTLIFTYKQTIMKNLDNCMVQKRKKDKKFCYYNIEPCKEEIDLLDNWIYTNEDTEDFQNYVTFE